MLQQNILIPVHHHSQAGVYKGCPLTTLTSDLRDNLRTTPRDLSLGLSLVHNLRRIYVPYKNRKYVSLDLSLVHNLRRIYAPHENYGRIGRTSKALCIKATVLPL
jgi:hypothetical protein